MGGFCFIYWTLYHFEVSRREANEMEAIWQTNVNNPEKERRRSERMVKWLYLLSLASLAGLNPEKRIQ